MGSRLEGLQRLLVIINKLEGKKRYVPTEELKRYIAGAMEMRGYSGKSTRTLERDIEDIQSLFGICIAYDKREQGYYIKEEDENAPERYGQLLQNRRRYESAHVCAGGASPSVAERVSSDADSRYQAYPSGYFPLYIGKAGR